ncbi:leucine-rich repeat protein [Ruminococcus flavefaciens]|uniref:leucine-rich repeat protein n=1 Tax=Ruminococcus flavefaciens TaxID=1265 RepID=UPI0002FFE503|nr:leucine-rich repeat protein [Ruminococcus flavefaciens]
MFKKIAAFCLASLFAAGPIITSTNSGATSSFCISAYAASDYSYKDNYGVTYTFTVNDDQKATLTGLSNAKANLILPSTVKANGVSYTVTALGNNFGKKNNTVKKLTIPASITTLGDMCFWLAKNLETINNGSGLTDVGSAVFYSSKWRNNQENQRGYSTLGKVLISYETSDTTLNMSTSTYNNIEYIANGAMSFMEDLKYLTLPRNLKKIGKDILYSISATQSSPSSDIEVIKFYDPTLKRYVDFYDVCMSKNRNQFQQAFIQDYFDTFACTKVAFKAADEYAKGILQECDITYKGTIENTGYTALEEYQIARKLYVYIGKNFQNYVLREDGGAKNFRSNFFTNRGIVCGDYAKMYEYLCNLAGINCKYVETIKDERHAFNVVKIGDSWFNADCCWTWNWGLSCFMTPDGIMENDVICHTKDQECKQYDCSTTMGDINFDGNINVIDASLIMDAYATMDSSDCEYSSLQLVLCDVNRDGQINATDASLVLAYYSYAASLRDSDGNYVTEWPSMEYYLYNVRGYSIIL